MWYLDVERSKVSSSITYVSCPRLYTKEILLLQWLKGSPSMSTEICLGPVNSSIKVWGGGLNPGRWSS